MEKNTCFPRWEWHCLIRGLNLPKGSPKGAHFEGQGHTPVKKTWSGRDARFSLISPSMWGSRRTRVWTSLATCCQGWTTCWGRSCRCRRSLGPRCARRTPFGIQTWQRERSTRRTATIKTETIKDDDFILHGVDANSVESEHSDDENVEADRESGLLSKIEPARHFWKLPWFLVLTYVGEPRTKISLF